MTTETRRAEIQARVEKATPGPWVCSDRGDGSGSVYAAPDDILPTALIDDYRCPYIRGEIRYEDGVFAAHAREDIPWLLGELSRLSEALLWRYGNADELATLLMEMRRWAECDRAAHGDGPSGGYAKRIVDATRAQELGLNALEQVARLSEVQEALRAVIETWRGYQRFSEAEVNHKVRSKDKTYRATRIAEAATLNVCISELEEIIKDRALARLTAAPEAQPDGAFAQAVRFQVEKNDIISAVYESHATTEEGMAIETLICDTVNRFMDDAFPGWRERPSARLTAAPEAQSEKET